MVWRHNKHQPQPQTNKVIGFSAEEPEPETPEPVAEEPEEELYEEPDEVLYGAVPLTGDKSMPFVWAGLALLAAAGVALLSVKPRKKEDK